MKNTFLLFIVLFINPIFSFSQTFEFIKSFKLDIYDAKAWVGNDDLVIIGRQNAPYFIYSILGERINPDEFSNTFSTQREFPLRVEKNSPDGIKMGIIGPDGNYLTPCIYEKIYPWVFGYCIAKRNEKYFMVDSEGKITSLGDDVQEASIVMTGIAACKNKKGKVGLIREDDQLLTDFQYRAIEKISSLDNHDFGVARISDNSYDDGLIDKTGRIVLPIVSGNRLKTAGHRLFVGRGSKSGVLGKDGNIKLTIPYKIIDLPISPFGKVNKFGTFTVGSGREVKYGIIDSNYNVVMSAKYPQMVILNDLYALASDCGFFPSKDCSHKSAIISLTGDTILVDSFEIPLEIMGVDAIIATTDGKNTGFYWYNSKGSKVLPYPIQLPVWCFKMGSELKAIPIRRKEQNYFCLFNGEGNMISADSFLSVSLIENTNLIWAEKGKGIYGVVDGNGKQIVPYELTWPTNVIRKKGLPKEDPDSVVGFMGSRRGKTTIFDKTGNIIFEKEGQLALLTEDYFWLKNSDSFEIYKINW